MVRGKFGRKGKTKVVKTTKNKTLNLNNHVPLIYRQALSSFLKDSRNEFIYKGGRGSVKSSIAALKVVLTVVQERGNSICIRRYKTTLKDSCYADVEQVIARLGYTEDFKFVKSPMEIRHKSGYIIYFRGLDSPTKIKSIRPKRGVFKTAWFEEADEITSYADLLSVKLSLSRGIGNRLTTVITYNPPESPLEWTNKEFEQNIDPKRFILHTTYHDVPPEWLGDIFFHEAEKMRVNDYETYLNVFEGKIVSGRTTIFKNVHKLDPARIPELKAQANYLQRGIDFGFANDPSVYVVWYYHQHSNSLYLLFEDYGYAWDNKDLAEVIMKENPYHNIVYADNQDSRSISDLNKYGCAGVTPCTKGPDSVPHGIKWLQRQVDAIYIPEFLPDGRPSLAYKEFSLYRYAKNRHGDILRKYPDRDNHTIDSTRYALQEYILS